MDRAQLRTQVTERLGRRRLVWIGTRGEDAESITDLVQFTAAYSVISRLDSRASIASLSLEELTGVRPDLDTYDLDDHLRDAEVGELRANVLRSLSGDSALLTYRPSSFASGVAFSRLDRCRYLGLFSGLQSAFEHKPWLESSIAGLGIAHIPWTYVADLDQFETVRLLDDGPVMLRPSRTTGGVGLVRLDDSDRLEELWPDEAEAYVSVAPFIEGGVPVNVGAVAWHDGITIHSASLQLIGIPGCTTRPFGFCGNDFGAVGELDNPVLDEIERSTVAVGDWLRGFGYLGAFGVDFLVKDNVPLFTEVNPRFQGSTHASCRMSVERDESCILLEHLAAFLGIGAPPTLHLRDLAHRTDQLAHIVVHHTKPDPRSIDASVLVDRMSDEFGFVRADVVAGADLVVEPGAAIARLTVRDRVTRTGFDLDPRWATAIDEGLIRL